MGNKKEVLEKIHHKLIVSCQARKGWAMYGPEIMAAFASAAMEGGAGGIRANGVKDITAIRKKVKLPMIGIQKIWTEGCEVYITPTYESAVPILETGVEIIALDGTGRKRPNGETYDSIVYQIREHYPDVLIMGEISTLKEAEALQKSGTDIISTTLSGYTRETAGVTVFKPELVREITSATDLPVIAEGRIYTVEELTAAYAAGAHAAVVGTAITRPEIITARYVRGLETYFETVNQ